MARTLVAFCLLFMPVFVGMVWSVAGPLGWLGVLRVVLEALILALVTATVVLLYERSAPR